MSDKSKTAKPSRANLREAYPKERAAFRSLLLANPNYFGNLVTSPFKPILPIAGNTHYEELACVGYQPQQRKLSAIVYVYQPSGYGTDICGPGTSEFVRFYLSFDGGISWHDQGMTSIQAYNIPEGTQDAKKLEYGVSLWIDPPHKLCVFDPLIRVRAILSWNNPPPPNQPDWPPVWGNMREATILVEPRRRFYPLEVLDAAKVKLTPEFKDLLGLDVPVEPKPKALTLAQRSELYKGDDVPLHRFAHKELLSFVSTSTNQGVDSFSKLLPGVTINPNIFDLLFPKTDGDASYEELKCIGLDPNVPDTLIGVIQVKKKIGYSGGPCTDGSHEYVTFWADFDGNGSFETCLGTASVCAYDLKNAPAAGVFYAARLPVDLNPYRRPCSQGPRVVRIRAILSWNTPVAPSDPNHVPTWGNREETLINVAPIAGAPAGKIAILGGIPVGQIDGVTGLTKPTAVFATNNLAPDTYGRPCPFARRVTAQGAPVPGYSYIVEVSPDGTVWTPVLTDLTVTDQFGNTSTHKANAVTKRFDYLSFTQNINSVLAQWDSAGDARWFVRLSLYDSVGLLQGTDIHVVQLDNTAPEVSITITAGTGDCGKFVVGDVLLGNFIARDTYFGSYSLGVEPSVNPPGVAVVSPASGTGNTAPAPGDNWSLNTTGMKACGYVVRLVAVDRAIVDSQWVGHWATDSTGFCLEESKKK